jgi:hypothetical protein
MRYKINQNYTDLRANKLPVDISLANLTLPKAPLPIISLPDPPLRVS